MLMGIQYECWRSFYFACFLICADTEADGDGTDTDGTDTEESNTDGTDTEDGPSAKKHKPDHSKKGVLHAHESTYVISTCLYCELV